jgi:hypothetical protein
LTVLLCLISLRSGRCHPTLYTRHPTPYALHPTPHTLNPTPCTLHPTPYTLHPAPLTRHTPHPTPHTRHKRPFVGVSGGRSWTFLSTFGENRPRFLKNLSKLTFEYPHEGPCVAHLKLFPLRSIAVWSRLSCHKMYERGLHKMKVRTFCCNKRPHLHFVKRLVPKGKRGEIPTSTRGGSRCFF